MLWPFARIGNWLAWTVTAVFAGFAGYLAWVDPDFARQPSLVWFAPSIFCVFAVEREITLHNRRAEFDAALLLFEQSQANAFRDLEAELAGETITDDLGSVQP